MIPKVVLTLKKERSSSTRTSFDSSNNVPQADKVIDITLNQHTQRRLHGRVFNILSQVSPPCYISNHADTCWDRWVREIEEMSDKGLDQTNKPNKPLRRTFFTHTYIFYAYIFLNM